tara:strand:- start:2816 stop:3595 length:780 start_codon:yes stop_codon:yes gene_type:complete
MQIKDLQEISEKLIPVFEKAGNIAVELQNKKIKIIQKSDGTPVTNGDLEVNKIIVEAIKTLTPNIPVVSEETVNLKEQNIYKTFWLIDPIDGTRDYIEQKNEYTINAALIIDKIPEIGLINAPKKNRIFFSYGKSHAFQISDNKKTLLDCKKKTEEGKIFALTHNRNPSEKISDFLKKNRVFKIIKMSSSLKFCVIAAGEADIYVCEPRAFEWDIAAGHAIVKHSGGLVTSDDGEQIFYGKNGFKNPALVVKRSILLEK